jgi:NADPH-dependent curcumin reductase
MSALHEVRLRRTPEGRPREDDFVCVPAEPLAADAGAAALAQGQTLVKVHALSLDPYLRSAMAGRHLSGAIQPGEVVRGEGWVEVLASGDARVAVGTHWVAACGWRNVAWLDAATWAAARPIDQNIQPRTWALGVLGMPGLTAWAGFTRLAQARAGDTLVVSAAAGPVGATVGQLARLAGCRVVGIAGGPEKARWLREVAGFDAVIDHRAGGPPELRVALKAACPQGIDVYFDNVGGDVLQAACEQLAVGARVVLCGLIAQYSGAAPSGPNPALFIRARATVRGLVVYDHWDALPQMQAEVGAHLRAGRLHTREDLAHGLAQAPAAFCRLMRGDNQGKALVLL